MALGQMRKLACLCENLYPGLSYLRRTDVPYAQYMEEMYVHALWRVADIQRTIRNRDPLTATDTKFWYHANRLSKNGY